MIVFLLILMLCLHARKTELAKYPVIFRGGGLVELIRIDLS